ncbi:MAG: glycosyltransferase [Tannerellaceae bacterium]|jgi:rhamnopyranosyl-N-acetylglucosaminyl-diphospho-decaprenol beta-1,3/1,4-galactofuranosyltransferase|nr:glycosyltransferase [Tannerellaceae bacterium]
MNKVAAVVVTYNRKALLCTCLESIRKQTLPPDAIYIVDNHSEIDTAETLLSYQFISGLPDRNADQDLVLTSLIPSYEGKDIRINYIYKRVNDGGAGGFYAGMVAAYHDGYEWLWMMDDDGIPVEDGLEQLLTGANTHNLDYANALVVSIEDRYSLAFGLEFGLAKAKTTIDDYKGVEIIHNAVNPFNGTLINRRIPAKIGFIKKEMVIWGDEAEYFLRSMRNGFSIGTVVKSIHYHPPNRVQRAPLLPFFSKGPQMFGYVGKDRDRAAIFYRNQGYLTYTYGSKKKVCEAVVKYSIFFITRLRFLEYRVFLQSFINGCRNKYK